MDRMDDIWKDRFNSEDLPLGEWNTPDNLVWQNIANNTVRKEGKRRAALWIWTVTGLLVLLLGIMFLNSNRFLSSSESANKNSTIAQIIDSSNLGESPTINKSSKSTSQKYHTFKNNKTANNQLEQNNTEDDLTSEQITEIPKTSSSKTIIPKKKKFKVTTISDQANANKSQKSANNTNANSELTKKQEAIPANTLPVITNIKSQNETKKSSTSVTTEKSNPQIAINLVGTNLPTTIASIEEVQLNLDDQGLNEPKSKLPISFTATIGASYWKHEISKNYTSDLSAFDFNYTDEFGYLLDLDASIPLGNRFALSTGLEYEQINISSGHNSALSYDPAAEGIDQSNAYELSLATPYGLAGAEFRFDRGEDIGDDPVELLVDFHSGHTIRNFSVPLNLEYYPLGKKRIINPVLKAGFGINYLSGISNKIKSIDTHHSAIQYDDSESSSFMAPNITKWHYDYRLGLGARIQWRRDFAIVLNYERIGGINPIFEQDAYNTSINRQHFSIGLNKVLLNIR